ncbi:MAG: CRISPR-associated endoribonuclease Cas6 [Bacteroidales bacterium]|nr:CRISPR-associated endoribonuclease Cas6 [Bacteroidales bacterium]
MRFKLSLYVADAPNCLLPVNYQYPLSAWIYKTIHEGDHAFARFLHETGFKIGGAAYKFFTFSRLLFPHHGFVMQGDRMKLLTDRAELVVSFLAPEAMQHFVSGLFSLQHFRIGDKKSAVSFRVEKVEALPLPLFKSTMMYRTLSPLLVSYKTEDQRNAHYFDPHESEYNSIFLNNLRQKAASAIGHGLIQNFAPGDGKLSFKPSDSKPKSNLLIIKADTPAETRIRGFMYSFELTAPPLLHKIGFLGGFGEKNSLGLGCVSIIKNENNKH